MAATTKAELTAQLRKLRKTLERENDKAARLKEKLAEALERQTATAEILKVIASSPSDVQPVFDAIVRNAVVLCGSAFGAVFRYDGEQLHFASGYKLAPRALEEMRARYPMRPDNSLVSGRAILSRSVARLEDVLADPDHDNRFAAAGGWRRVLGVPMLREGIPIGVIFVAWAEPGSIPDVQVELLKTFADQAVIAIENVRLFNETKEALERQMATAEILRAISNSPTDVQPVFEAIARNALALCGSSFANVFRYDGNLMHYVASHQVAPEQVERVKGGYPRPPDRGRVAGRAILSRSVVCIDDALADPEYDRPVAASAGWRRMFAVPMLREDTPFGAIAVGWTEPGPIPKDQVDLLQTFADQAVIAIENVRLFNETKEALEHQTATAEVLQVISGSKANAAPVFDRILASCRNLFRESVVTLGLVDEHDIVHLHQESQNFVHADDTMRRGAEAIQAAHPRPARESIYGYVAYKRKTMHFPDVQHGVGVPEGLRKTVEVVGRNYAALYTPLLWEGRGIGTLCVSRQAPASFSEKEIQLLKTFADQAVIAIQNARLFNETKEALEQQKASVEVLRVISSSPTDIQPVFDAIVRSAASLFQPCDATITMLEDGFLRWYATAGVERTQMDVEKAKAVYPLPFDPDRSPSSRAILERRVVEIMDAAAPDTPALARIAGQAGGFRSAVFVPLLRAGEGIGTIILTHPQPGFKLTGKQLALVQTFASQAVIAIENVRLFNELETRNRDLSEALEQQTATAEILRVISSSPTTLAPVLEAVVKTAARLCDATNASLYRVEGDLMRKVAGHGSVPTAIEVGDTRPVTRGTVSGRAMLERRTLHIPDLLAEADTQDPVSRDYVRREGIRTFVATPLLREGVPIGAITVYRTEVRLFSDKQIGLLQTFADQAVIAIENVRLFKELQAQTAALSRSVGQLTALGEVGQAISSTLELETVLKTIVQHAVQLTGLDGGSIYEYDEGSGQFSLQASENIEPELVEAVRRTPVRKGEGAIGHSAVTREPVQVADILDDSYHSGRKEILVRAGYRAILAVPLLREDHLLGALQVFRRTPGAFAPEIVELLKTFATQSAMAIQNARLFREIAEKGRQLEVASRHKSDFLASMSHELRTPLNAILGFNEMILAEIYGAVPADMKEPLADIQSSGRHLLRLINNVLDLAKIEAGRMELALADYSVQDTVESVRSTLRPLAADKGLEFLATVPADIPLAHGDAGRITQCLMNLAGNSLKFTKTGKVVISVEQKDGLLTYRVADTGMGIPPDKIGSLFTEFKQTDSTIASEYGGTGLGLSISRKFIEMHGGRIWVESELGKGSTFIFEIPLRAGEGRSA